MLFTALKSIVSSHNAIIFVSLLLEHRIGQEVGLLEICRYQLVQMQEHENLILD
jgi:hypothetical protein